MCGRFTLFSSDAVVGAFFGANEIEGEHQPTYNQAPSQPVRVATGNEPRVLTLQKWGLVPSWAKPDFRPLINARAETITEKPAFRAAAQRRRCLIPTNGYYEWETRGHRKQPYFISGNPADADGVPPANTPLLAMAGIFDYAHGPDGETIPTCAILTRDAPESLPLHPRTPLFVPPSFWDEWLNPGLTEKAGLREMVDAIPYPNLHAQPVNRSVGNFRTEDPQLIFD